MFPSSTYILIVDDSRGTRLLLAGIFNELGYKRIRHAENGKEAISVLAACVADQDPIQLVIADINMPEMNGIEFLVAVRADPIIKGCPIIMVTADFNQDLIAESIRNGAISYIIKPITAPLLKGKLYSAWKTLLRRQQPENKP